MKIYEILIILFCHWMFDFVFQTDKQAKGKSKNWGDLLSHTSIYSLCWVVPVFILYGGIERYMVPSLFFCIITFCFHTVTDYYTSRLNSKLWERGAIHAFFVSIGFDQFLHFTQLLLTYTLLQK